MSDELVEIWAKVYTTLIIGVTAGVLVAFIQNWLFI